MWIHALMDAIEGGEYFKLYEKWFGPKSEVPYPLSPEQDLLKLQVVPNKRILYRGGFHQISDDEEKSGRGDPSPDLRRECFFGF